MIIGFYRNIITNETYEIKYIGKELYMKYKCNENDEVLKSTAPYTLSKDWNKFDTFIN